MDDQERVHPAAMGGADQQVTAARQQLLARCLDPEPEDPKQKEQRKQPHDTIEERGAGLRLPAKPAQTLKGSAISGAVKDAAVQTRGRPTPRARACLRFVSRADWAVHPRPQGRPRLR